MNEVSGIVCMRAPLRAFWVQSREHYIQLGSLRMWNRVIVDVHDQLVAHFHGHYVSDYDLEIRIASPEEWVRLVALAGLGEARWHRVTS